MLPASQASVIEGHDHGEVLLDVERKLSSGKTIGFRSTSLGLVVVNADQLRHRLSQCLKQKTSKTLIDPKEPEFEVKQGFFNNKPQKQLALNKETRRRLKRKLWNQVRDRQSDNKQNRLI